MQSNTQPTAYTLESDETGALDLGELRAHWSDTRGPEEEEAGAVNWGAAFAAGSTGAGIGAAIGTVVPGLGNVAGGAIGAGIGAGFSILGGVLKKPPKAMPQQAKPQTKPIAPYQREALQAAKRNPADPYLAADVLLMGDPSFSYLKAKAAGKLPSQIAMREEGRKRAQEIEAKSGEKLRNQLKGYSFEERSLIGAALTAGYGKQMHRQIATLREQRRREEEEAAALERKAKLDQSILELEQKQAMLEQDIAAKIASAAEAKPVPIAEPMTEAPEEEPTEAPEEAMQPGMQRPTLPTSADRPRPVFHVSQVPFTKEAMAKLLTHVDAVWNLPKRQKLLIAGRLTRGVRDVSGIDATTGEYVAKPSQTAAGIAQLLTGDETRGAELIAANPMKPPHHPRWKIPPSFGIGYQRIDSYDEAGDSTKEPEKLYTDPEAHLTDPPKAEKAPEKSPAAAPAKTPPKATAKANFLAEDSIRQPTTYRVYTVRAGEVPYMFAAKVGATKIDPQWWKSLKQANPHKATVDGGQNFKTYYAGEILNYPNHWPNHAEAIAAGPAPFPTVPQTPNQQGSPNVPMIPATWPWPPNPGQPNTPPPQPTSTTVATMDPGVMSRMQGILIFWRMAHPQDAPIADFGTKPEDISGTDTARTRTMLQAWQVWENKRVNYPKVRTDGVLDQPTYQALNDYFCGPALAEVPAGTVPYAPKEPVTPYTMPWQVPAPGSQGGGGSTAPGGNPYPQTQPQPQPTTPQGQSASADDGTPQDSKDAAIMIPVGIGLLAALFSA